MRIIITADTPEAYAAALANLAEPVRARIPEQHPGAVGVEMDVPDPSAYLLWALVKAGLAVWKTPEVNKPTPTVTPP